MDTELNLNGIFVDNLHVLRIIDPVISHETIDLKDESRYYTASERFIPFSLKNSFSHTCHFPSHSELDDFRALVQDILTLTLKFNADVDREKIKTIGAENLLKSTARKQEMQKQEIQSQLQEKSAELEQLKTELQMLARIEAQQREIIDNFCQDQ